MLALCCTLANDAVKGKRRISHSVYGNVQNQALQFHPVQARAGLSWALSPLLQRQVPSNPLENVLKSAATCTS